MKIVVAVSGGIDSVVLLDMLVEQGEHELVVAHFDHGMRQDSAADARFVEALARRYGLIYEGRREELVGASEELARDRRYEFLFAVSRKYRSELATAHHMGDVVETVALNIARGTQWRGLAGMSDLRIWRPLTGRTKSELKQYAQERRLEWVEDETNATDAYSRNRIRRQLASLPENTIRQLYRLWQNQVKIRGSIESEIMGQDFPIYDRYFLTMIEPVVAYGLLHSELLDRTGVSLLSSQLRRLLLAIKTARPGSVCQVGGGVSVQIELKKWRVKEPQKMVK